jgi:hypothetical protein
MGVSVAWVLLPAYFLASSWRHQCRRRNSLLGEEWNSRERWASNKVTKTSWRENKSNGDVELRQIWGFSIGGSGQGLPFYDRSGLQRSSKLAGVSGVDNTELDNGQPVGSRRRERDCGRKRQSGVTASYSRGTDKDKVPRSEELTVMGRRMRRDQGINILSLWSRLRGS